MGAKHRFDIPSHTRVFGPRRQNGSGVAAMPTFDDAAAGLELYDFEKRRDTALDAQCTGRRRRPFACQGPLRRLPENSGCVASNHLRQLHPLSQDGVLSEAEYKDTKCDVRRGTNSEHHF